MRFYSIGEVSFKLGGVSKEKIKSLENRKLIIPKRVGRRGDRLYSSEDIERIEIAINKEQGV